jgi:hypothetical protein
MKQSAENLIFRRLPGYWIERENCYVCYFRKWIEKDGKQIRIVGRSTSKDFIKWSKPVAMDLFWLNFWMLMET